MVHVCLHPTSYHEFHKSVKIIDLRGEGWIHETHENMQELCETKIFKNIMRQTWFQGYSGEQFADI